MIIAIDGYSSTGKSTIAKIIAKKLNITYIDTGAMYRAFTLYLLEKYNTVQSKKNFEEFCLDYIEADFLPKNVRITFEKGIITLNGINVEDKIRSLTIANHVSDVAKIKKVRIYLVDLQREMSENFSVILDGRDIGTVVFPNADYKFFLTASDDIRAQRRYLEMKNTNPTVDFEEVKQNLIRRDKIDSSRKESPLKKAVDAIEIDNSNLTVDEQINTILNKINKAI